MEKQAIEDLKWLALYCTVKIEEAVENHYQFIREGLPADYHQGIASGMMRALSVVQIYVKFRVEELERSLDGKASL